MRRQREVGYVRRALAVAGALGLLAGVARADVTTERSASILVFPKVIATATRDTIIQITNTNNSMVHAHCFYVNGALTFPDLPAGPLNPPLWTETDFDIWLTKQQPTVWVVSIGRDNNPFDLPCSPLNAACYGAGLDPGLVPARRIAPAPSDFTGELKCIETDASDTPVPGNHLKGEATLVDLRTGDVAKYNGIGVLGDPNVPDDDGVLCLGGDQSDACPNGAEYNACPQTWILNHFADDADDPIADDAGATFSNVDPALTIVPCTENFEAQVPTSVTIQFSVTNEFEQAFSASTTVTCWEEIDDIDSINESAFSRFAIGTTFAQTRMRASNGGHCSFSPQTGCSNVGASCGASAGTCVPNPGFMAVAEEYHTARIGGVLRTAVAAHNLHIEGEQAGHQDLITIPIGQFQPPQPTP